MLINTYQLNVCYAPPQIYQFEKQWFAKGNPSFALMQQAAWQVTFWLKNYYLNDIYKKNLQKKQIDICVIVGSGNNGGDGWLIANYLFLANFRVAVYEVATANREDSKIAKKMASENNIHIFNADKTPILPTANIYIDALFGIGLDREPTGIYAKTIKQLNHYKTKHDITIVSIDLPSGLNATTGEVYQKIAVKANFTLCLLAYKQGLFIKDATDYVGKIILLPIIPIESFMTLTKNSTEVKKPIGTNVLMNRHFDHVALPKRPANSHKGSYGHVLVIGGNVGMAGAAILSAEAAFATGAGKVTLACHKEYHNAVLARNPNIMTANLTKESQVTALIKEADVVCIGMGMGRDEHARALTETYLTIAIAENKSLLVDADALYHLASLPTLQNKLIEFNKPKRVWLTPHSGEAAKLLKMNIEDIESDRIEAACLLNDLIPASWLLKGNGSIVRQNNQNYICALGNAGMATAGMGDVLAGIASGLQAQSLIDATLLDAVAIHACTGDFVAKKYGEYSLQASTIIDGLHHILNQSVNHDKHRKF